MLEYIDEFVLRESDFDFRDNMKVSAYLDLFQTVASAHASVIGVGYEETIAKGLAWVIAKVKLDILLPLHSSDRVKVVTRPLKKGSLDYIRDYYIYNDKGELAVMGSSQWLLIDFVTRKISRPVLDYAGECTDKSAYENRRIEKIAPFVGDTAYSHTVTAVDLDHNGHTNNIRYADMMLCACPDEKRAVKRVIINYNGEAKLGDKIDISVKTEGDATLYYAVRNGECCFTARVEF